MIDAHSTINSLLVGFHICIAVSNYKMCILFPAPRQRGVCFLSVPTSRQYFAFDGVPVIKALVPQPHWGWHDVVLCPFPQGLVVETKPLLYKFCAIVSATFQYNRVFHVSLYLLSIDTTYWSEDTQ
jgi:hypothetical protein